MEEESLGREIIRRIEGLDDPTDDEARKIVDELTAEDEPQPQPPFDGHIESIRVQGIRSFGEEQELELSRGLTIVYAENGTGKTSFVDAVELLTTGATTRAKQTPNLKNEVKDEAHIQHSTVDGKGVIAPCVSITWNQDGTGRDVTWSGSWGVGAAGVPAVQLLARRRLREIINSSGVDRATALGDAVGLTPTAMLWGDAKKSLENEVARLLSAAPSGPGHVVSRATEFLAQNGSQAGTGVDDIAKIIESAARDRVDLLRRQSGTQAHPEVWSSPFQPPPAVPDVTDVGDLADRLDAQVTSAPPVVIEDAVVRLFKAFLAVAEEGESCPACAVGAVTAARIGEVQRSLAAGEGAREARERVEQLRGAARDELMRISGRDLHWTAPVWDETALNAFPGGGEFTTGYHELQRSVAEWADRSERLRAAVESARQQLTPEALRSVVRSMVDLGEVRGRVVDRASSVELSRSETVRSLRGDELRAAEQERDAAHHIAEVICEKERSKALAAALKTAATHIGKRRTQVLDEKLADLADPINSWIRKLAPAHTPAIKLKVDGSNGGPRLSVLIEGGKVTAIGRLSDSQLDMLGLACHLATIEREHVGAPLILDDPTDMLDAETVRKLASDGVGDLLGPLTGEAKRQIVVLTHDQQLVQRLWEVHGSRLPCTVQWHLELDKESDSGPRTVLSVRSPLGYLDRLKSLIAENKQSEHRLWLRSAAGNLARQALESISGDLMEVFGPRGHGYIKDDAAVVAARTQALGYRAERLRSWLLKINEMHGKCKSDSHKGANYNTAKMLDSIDKSDEYLLNKASHADFVYPSVSFIDEYGDKLSQLAQLFGSRSDADASRPDDWPRTCHWYRLLKPCDDCKATDFFPDYTP